MKDYPLHSKEWIDCGFGLGVAVLLLQLAALLVPAGEARDWLFYLLAGGWAAMWISGAIVNRFFYFAVPGRLRVLKLALALYAVAVVSFYALPPLFGRMYLWVWPLALLVAWEWARRLDIRERRTRLIYAACMAWFILCALSLAGSLIYRALWFGLMSNRNLLHNATPYIMSLAIACPLIYAALRRPYTDAVKPSRMPAALSGLLHAVALYLLAVPLFRVDGLMYPVSTHHWKAFLEPAASLRSGGWLLWDVPAQYGFLQTWLTAAIPAASVWQSFYLLGGALLTLSGFMLFYVLFAKYRSATGFIASLALALSCTAQLLPFIDSRMMPSTGAIRFIFVYALAGYACYLCRRFAVSHALPRGAYIAGNALWLLGVLWSLESAVFSTIIWLPALVFIAVADRPPLGLYALRLLSPLLALALAAAAIAGLYHLRLGHLPDMQLFTAYAASYTGGFNSYPIERPGIATCWLFVYFMMMALAQAHAARAAFRPLGILHMAALGAALSGLWAAFSAFIPISDDVHLAGTLPLLVYLAALVSLLLPALELPQGMKAAYDKALICLYAVILLGTANCFKPGLYTAESMLAPIHGDVTEIFPAPPQFMQDIVKKAGIPEGAHVLVLAQPFSLEEGAVFRGMHLQPWLLPNTEVGYGKPLAPELYQLIAQRRAERMEGREGWVIERKDNPLENYPWIKDAIGKFYKEAARRENSEYRIRRFEKITAPASIP